MQNAFGLNRSLGGAIAAIAIVSVLGSSTVIATLRQLNAAATARQLSDETVRDLDAFRKAMLDQETSLRGYLITGRDSSLEPYRSGRSALEEAIGGLHGKLDGDRGQAERLSQAIKSARAWQANVGEVAIRDMANPSTRANAIKIETSGEGRQYFDQLRETLAAVQADEERTARIQDAALDQAKRSATFAIWAGSSITLLICALVALAINRLIVKSLTDLADAMRRLVQRDLDVEVPGTRQRNEVGAMARAVEVFKGGLIELDRRSLLRVTADTLPAMVGYVDARRRIGFLNEEFSRWFDLKVDDVAELQGRPLTEAFAGDRFPGAGRQLDAAFAGEDVRFEHRLVRRGTGRRDVEAFFRPHRAPDGTVLGVVTLLTDSTERRAMERSLAKHARDLVRSNEELEQFAYVASHDLKAPLRGIENLVSWIEEDLEGTLTGDTQTNMDLLKSRVRRLESLLEDLLTYSRAGRGQTVVETIDIERLVDELAVLVSPPDGFVIAGSSTLPIVQAPRAPLTQIIQNLIGNAIKHHDSPADGHVWIEASQRTDALKFVVTDDGPGVPAQFRERVFGMFQTLRPRDEVEGSGMGLAIVKKLVDRHGGKVWLDDGPQGRGLAVHFTWPVATGELDGADG